MMSERICVTGKQQQAFTLTPEWMQHLAAGDQLLDYIFFGGSGLRKHVFTVSIQLCLGHSDGGQM